MSGMRDLMPTIASTLAAQYTITNPTTSLADVRILGSNDATYGTANGTWVPEVNGAPFAVVFNQGVSDATPEPNRVWATYHVSFFVAIDHADTPALAQNYNDLLLAWMDQARQVVASNRRLYPGSNALWPQAGDVQWLFKGASVQDRYNVLGTEFLGVLCHTTVRLVLSVTYQN